MKHRLLILMTACFITLVALVLRTYSVDRIPPALSWDEVSIGYNAYSILTTGKDEHGRFLPVDTFVAYGDYKPPLAVYLTVPFVAVFGLTDMAVRLPSAIFGTLTVLLVYFLVKELFGNAKKLNGDMLALVAMAVLAISPWHVNLSRGGFEANIALFFSVLGIWLVLSGRTHSRRWVYAWLPFVGAIYTFNSSRVFILLFVPALLIYTYRDIRKNLNLFVAGVLLAGALTLPILPHLLSPQARLRFTEVNIFTDVSIVETANTRIEREKGNIIGQLVNNRRIGYAKSFLSHFLDNLQPNFLFVKGDGNPKFSIQDVGQLYFIEAPLLVIGVFGMLISYPGTALLLLYFIIAAIIPAATARETPHALRILNSLPTWHIFIAFGILSICRYVKKGRLVYCLLLGALYFFSITYYLHTYYRHYPAEYSGEWQYGYREAIQYIAPIASNYDKILVTDSIGRPYMYTLFYTKTDPNDLLRTKNATFDAAGFYHMKEFLNYRFGEALPGVLEPKTLYIWNEAPKGARVLKTVHLLNGQPMLAVFDNGGVAL